MKITILTLFPEYFESALRASILGRAQIEGKVEFQILNIRDFATDKHRVTDDRPYGGGAGMVMKVEPIDLALQHVLESQAGEKTSISVKRILLSAKGRMFDQNVAREYAAQDHLILICGHYEGVDERVAEYLIDEELRIGDYVLTGGEPAALVVADAVSRLVPGVLGNDQSLEAESHDVPGELGHPVYTRPEDYNGWTVPEILLSGDHKQIEEWRKSKKRKPLE